MRLPAFESLDEKRDALAARDTTFDGVQPESLWISHRTTPDRKYIVCFVEINGVEKEISRFYVHDYDGLVCESTNLTWILKSPTQASESGVAPERKNDETI